MRSSPRGRATHEGLTAQSRWQNFEQSKWALAVVLIIQAAFAARLIWTNSAFQDEALYIWAGHMEWTHWLDGVQLPNLASYFSGAPVFYPALAAYADAVAGLAGARILSLIFMLVATTLLHGVTRRTFGHRAAFLAAGLFAGLGSVQFLGALATYDAFALMLLATATWLGVRAASAGARARVGLLLLATFALVLADIAKYSALLFDPVVIASAGLFIGSLRGRLAGICAAAGMAALASVLLIIALHLAGPGYWEGIKVTTLVRPKGPTSPVLIVYLGATWVGVVMALGIVGAAVVWSERRGWAMRLMAVVLGVAPFLAPLSQAHMHVLTSLYKHVAFGSWFGAILAGFALASLPNAVPSVKARAAEVIAVLTLAFALIPGVAVASAHFTDGWPDTAGYVKALRPYIKHGNGPILVDEGDTSIVKYYLPKVAPWQWVNSTGNFSYHSLTTGKLLRGKTALDEAVQTRYFRVITITKAEARSGHGATVMAAIRKYHDYRLAKTVTAPPSNTHFLIYVVTRGKSS